MIVSSKKPRKAKAIVIEKELHKCEFCKKDFQHESSLLTHMCEPKRRYLSKDEKHVRLGYYTYTKFYEITYPTNKGISYDKFMKSRHYIAFVKFGKYLSDIQAVSPDNFIEFVIKGQLPLDKWHSPVVYETYIRELNKKESPDAALERNLLLMNKWGIETGENWTDFFRKVATPLAVQWIKSGRISPWVLYTATSAEALLSRMNEEQIELIGNFIEPKFWEQKLHNHKAEVINIRTELEAVGI